MNHATRWLRRRSHLHCNGWSLLRRTGLTAGTIAAAGLVLTAATAAPARASAHHHARQPVAVSIGNPHFTTIYDHAHHRSLLRISMTETTYNTPPSFDMFMRLYKWGPPIPGNYKHGKAYFGCGANWDKHCAWRKLLVDLAPAGHKVTWRFDAICNTHRHEGGGTGGRFYIRISVFLPSTLVTYFPSPAPHKKQPDRKQSYLAKCPKR